MAEIAPPPTLKPSSESYSAKLVDDEIPTVDYCMLFSNDPDQASLPIEHLGKVCQDYGFFYLVNHQIPEKLLDALFKGISEFFDPSTLEERKIYTCIPRHAILIQLGDHLEILTNGNLAPEFVNEEHPQAYVGMTYKQSLEANGGDEIDAQSSLDQIRLLRV
ncbi:hypothetical protein K1719_025557 [Acacia pycnantha]|nr:hypothetical protein K1719_025557 [Acacia pycnantha]